MTKVGHIVVMLEKYGQSIRQQEKKDQAKLRWWINMYPIPQRFLGNFFPIENQIGFIKIR